MPSSKTLNVAVVDVHLYPSASGQLLQQTQHSDTEPVRAYGEGRFLKKSLRLRCRNKTITTADRRHLQVQRGVFRVTAFIQHLRIGLLARKDRHEHGTLRMMLAKVITKSALSTVNCLHSVLLLAIDKSYPAPRIVASKPQLSQLYALGKSL
jgi:hypothetical protein